MIDGTGFFLKMLMIRLDRVESDSRIEQGLQKEYIGYPGTRWGAGCTITTNGREHKAKKSRKAVKDEKDIKSSFKEFLLHVGECSALNTADTKFSNTDGRVSV